MERKYPAQPTANYLPSPRRALQRLFNNVVPGTEQLPGFLNRQLLSDIDVEILPSPLDVSEIEGDFTFIAVESSGYNLAASYVENSLHSIGRFTDDMAAVTLPGVPSLSGDHYAFVQRAGNSKRTAFYVAWRDKPSHYGRRSLSRYSMALLA